MCPGEEFALAAEVSRLHCKVEVHNGLINHTRTAHNARDSVEMIPQDLPGPSNPAGLLPMARWGSFRMLHIYYSTSVHLHD